MTARSGALNIWSKSAENTSGTGSVPAAGKVTGFNAETYFTIEVYDPTVCRECDRYGRCPIRSWKNASVQATQSTHYHTPVGDWSGSVHSATAKRPGIASCKCISVARHSASRDGRPHCVGQICSVGVASTFITVAVQALGLTRSRLAVPLPVCQASSGSRRFRVNA